MDSHKKKTMTTASKNVLSLNKPPRTLSIFMTKEMDSQPQEDLTDWLIIFHFKLSENVFYLNESSNDRTHQHFERLKKWLANRSRASQLRYSKKPSKLSPVIVLFSPLHLLDLNSSILSSHSSSLTFSEQSQQHFVEVTSKWVLKRFGFKWAYCGHENLNAYFDPVLLKGCCFNTYSKNNIAYTSQKSFNAKLWQNLKRSYLSWNCHNICMLIKKN